MYLANPKYLEIIFVFTSPPVIVRSIAMSLYVCMCVRSHFSKPHAETSHNLMQKTYVLSVNCGRGSDLL